jgi:hypothetical protein
MPQTVDGFELKFVSRLRKAERRHNGRLIDTIPVTWASTWRQAPPVKSSAAPKGAKAAAAAPKEIFLEVWYQDAAEMEARKADAAPFIVAVATTKGDEGKPEKFAEFRGVFEVIATGEVLGPNSLESKIIRRAKPAAE